MSVYQPLAATQICDGSFGSRTIILRTSKRFTGLLATPSGEMFFHIRLFVSVIAEDGRRPILRYTSQAGGDNSNQTCGPKKSHFRSLQTITDSFADRAKFQTRPELSISIFTRRICIQFFAVANKESFAGESPWFDPELSGILLLLASLIPANRSRIYVGLIANLSIKITFANPIFAQHVDW